VRGPRTRRRIRTAPRVGWRDVISNGGREQRKAAHVLGVVVHDDGHAVHGEAVRLRHQALAEAVGDVVRAEQAADDRAELKRDERERDGVPAAEDVALKVQELVLAPGERAAGVARLRDGRLDERREVAAAAERVLDARAAVAAELARPELVELALERERPLLVRDVAGCDEEREDGPEEHGVDREEHPIVEQDARPADERREHAEGRGERGEDELGLVRNAEDVGVRPDVEPGEDAENEGNECVDGELQY
jgi:hypothetical protein